MKKILGVILALAIPLAMIGCATTVESSDGFETSTRAVAATAASSVTGQSSDTATFVVATTPAEVVLDDAVNDVTEAPDLSAVTEITLGEAIQIAGDGATVDGKGVLISRGGVYRLTGRAGGWPDRGRRAGQNDGHAASGWREHQQLGRCAALCAASEPDRVVPCRGLGERADGWRYVSVRGTLRPRSPMRRSLAAMI